MKLGLVIRKIEVDTKKIDGSSLETYRIVIASFLIQNKLEMVWFFGETFLIAYTSMKVILEMSFLIFSDANIRFT